MKIIIFKLYNTTEENVGQWIQTGYNVQNQIIFTYLKLFFLFIQRLNRSTKNMEFVFRLLRDARRH